MFSEYVRFEPIKAEIHSIHNQQNLILTLLVLLLALIALRYLYKLIKWLRQKRCIGMLLKKLQLSKSHGGNMQSKDDLGATTIRNVMAMSADVERAPSQIYSVTGRC